MNFFQNQSTLSLSHSLQQQNGQQQNNNNNNNPYRNPLNSRFTLSFNNLISRTSRTNNLGSNNNSNQNTTITTTQKTSYFPSLHRNNTSNQNNTSPTTSTSQETPYFPGSHRHNNSTQLNQNNTSPPTSTSQKTPYFSSLHRNNTSTMHNSSNTTSTSQKTPYFPGLRRIQSRKKDKESTSNEQSTLNSNPTPPLPTIHQNQSNQQQQIRSISQPPPIPRVIRSTTERLRNHNNSPEIINQSNNSNQSSHQNKSNQQTSNENPQIINSTNNTETFSIRLVPHLDTTRSLHFEPIERNLTPSSSLKLGRFTDRGIPQSNSDTRIAFKSKVVSRGHADIFTDNTGAFFIKDTKSSSGTFLNHIRLSAPGSESRPFPLRDGDVLQLGVDYQGGTEEIYRCVKMRVELNRAWQRSANVFNQKALAQLRSLGAKGSTPKSNTSNDVVQNQSITTSAPIETEPIKPVSDCCICLFGVTVCQALFIAPCSHTYHYKCIRPLLQMHHPGFSCPLCRTFADLEADIETEEIVTPSSKKHTSIQPAISNQNISTVYQDSSIPIPNHPVSPADRSTFFIPNPPTTHLSQPSSPSSPSGIVLEEELESIQNVDHQDSFPMTSEDDINLGDRTISIPTGMTTNDQMETIPNLPIGANSIIEIHQNHQNNSSNSGIMIVNNQPMMMGLVIEEAEDQIQSSSSPSDNQDLLLLNNLNNKSRNSIPSDDDDGSFHDQFSPTNTNINHLNHNHNQLVEKSKTSDLPLPINPLLLSDTHSIHHQNTHQNNNNNNNNNNDKNLDQIN